MPPHLPTKLIQKLPGSWLARLSNLKLVLPSFRYMAHTEDQFEAVAHTTPSAMLGHAINTTIAILALQSVAPTGELVVWGALSLLLAGYMVARCYRARHRPSGRPHRNLARLEHRAIGFAALLALPWAYLIVRFLGSDNQAAETILISLGVGMAASGAVLLAPVERAATTYMSVILAATTATCFLLLDGTQYVLLGWLAVSYWLFLLALIATTNELFKNKASAVVRLEAALAEARSAREEIEHAATHDALTGLANRRAFLQHLNQRIAAPGEETTNWAVFLLDLDQFKTVNDTLGHTVGDELLQLAAARLASSMRPTDVVARLGGDEFSLLTENVTDETQAKAIAGRLVNKLSLPFRIGGQTINIGVSVGIALARPGHLSDVEDLMKCADLALYDAKAAGRNGFKVFEVAMQERMEARRSVEMGLRQALAAHELELYFQPIYHLTTMKVARFEALLRWHHPERGLLGPGEFMTVAEEMGLITEIGEWVLHEGCRQAATWPEDVSLALNLSPIQVNQTDLVPVVRSALVRSGLPPKRLEIEITETALLSDKVKVKARLERLKELGVSLSMDDFGTGYSSLSYLASFPFDALKIDKAFIAGDPTQSENTEIMWAMIALAKTLGHSSTVEGIETLEQLHTAQALGATFGQGYYFSRPQPVEQVPLMLLGQITHGPLRAEAKRSA